MSSTNMRPVVPTSISQHAMSLLCLKLCLTQSRHIHSHPTAIGLAISLFVFTRCQVSCRQNVKLIVQGSLKTSSKCKRSLEVQQHRRSSRLQHQQQPLIRRTRFRSRTLRRPLSTNLPQTPHSIKNLQKMGLPLAGETSQAAKNSISVTVIAPHSHQRWNALSSITSDSSRRIGGPHSLWAAFSRATKQCPQHSTKTTSSTTGSTREISPTTISQVSRLKLIARLRSPETSSIGWSGTTPSS